MYELLFPTFLLPQPEAAEEEGEEEEGEEEEGQTMLEPLPPFSVNFKIPPSPLTKMDQEVRAAVWSRKRRRWWVPLFLQKNSRRLRPQEFGKSLALEKGPFFAVVYVKG